jgi:uncharacterized protein DUF6335
MPTLYEIEPLIDDYGINVDSGRYELRRRLENNNSSSPALAGGDIDAQWEMAESTGDETALGSSPTPDQNVVDEWGRALGIEFGDAEELDFEKAYSRDRHRWELDPASSEDYLARRR